MNRNPENQLHLVPDSSRIGKEFHVLNQVINYKTLRDEWFWKVPEYREFLFDYIRFHNIFDGYVGEPRLLREANYTLEAYHAGYAFITPPVIRDWFITKIILYGMRTYSVEEVEPVYERYLKECRDVNLVKLLKEKFESVKRLKKGNMAPAFTLTDENGKPVSLAAFKGKVVYLDFWGVGCGPCIYDIQNYAPAMHERYKSEDVVFINICVDAEGEEWKAALKKYNVKGINLNTKDWAEHPVCQAYNVDAVPHYILIDKEGRIVSSHASSPREFQPLFKNDEIDVLLK